MVGKRFSSVPTPGGSQQVRLGKGAIVFGSAGNIQRWGHALTGVV